MYLRTKSLCHGKSTSPWFILLAIAGCFLLVGCDLTGGYQQRIEDAAGKVGGGKPVPAAPADAGDDKPAEEQPADAKPAAAPVE